VLGVQMYVKLKKKKKKKKNQLMEKQSDRRLIQQVRFCKERYGSRMVKVGEERN
jgi:hypothetical protein